MQFGVREICDVVFKAKSTMKVGKKTFFKGEPVIYFDSLTTSTLEGASTTVYAQGGRGNARLIAWEGERTLTFTMEDALMSPAGFMILSGAGLINEANGVGNEIIVHKTETTDEVDTSSGVVIKLKEKPVNPVLDTTIAGYEGAGVYVFDLDEDGAVHTEPFIPDYNTNFGANTTLSDGSAGYSITLRTGDDVDNTYGKFQTKSPVLVDYYVAYQTGVTQIDITPESFGGNFYIEASTLFRDKASGKDLAAEFVIPSGKVQSNFTFTMAASGDPSTFTFTVDAFPDYTRFNKTKKVLAALQIVEPTATGELEARTKTAQTDTQSDTDIKFRNPAVTKELSALQALTTGGSGIDHIQVDEDASNYYVQIGTTYRQLANGSKVIAGITYYREKTAEELAAG